MVEKKDSMKRDFHEGREIDRKKESRRKRGAPARPTRSERETLGVENGDSTPVSADSTILPVQETSPPESERPGILTPDQIKAVQNDYRVGFTVKQIQTVTGIKPATIYKHIRGIEQQPIPAPEENSKSNATLPDPPASTLSQSGPQSSAPSAPPPKIVEVSEPIENDTERTRPRDPEPDGDGYGSYGSYQRESHRPPLPVTDSDTISQLLMILGRDMRKRGFTNFPDFFEYYLLPQLERLEFWQENLPGNTPEEKDRTFRRYLWIVERFLRAQKEYGEYETVNKGVKLEGS